MGLKQMIKYTLILSCVFYGTIVFIFLQNSKDVDTEFQVFQKYSIKTNINPGIEDNDQDDNIGKNKHVDVNKNFETRKLEDITYTTESLKFTSTKNMKHSINHPPKKRQILAEMWNNYRKLTSKNETRNSTTNSFKSVGEDIYVYSAYYDDRQLEQYGSAIVRIVAISKLKSKDNLLCKFSKSRAGKWILAHKQDMSDSHEKLYGGVMYICIIPPSFNEKPPMELHLRNVLTLGANNSYLTSETEILATLQIVQQDQPSSLMDGIYHDYKSENISNHSWQDISQHADNTSWNKNTSSINSEDKNSNISISQGRQLINNSNVDNTELSAHKNKTKIAVCVPPIFGNVRISDFIQFIEIHKILGVSHFIFYLMDVSDDIHRMLNFYKKDNLVTTLNWDLPEPVKRPSAIWYNGQSAAIHDCLHRTMGKFNFTAFVDLDEVIVPKHTQDWSTMLQELDDQHSKDCDERPAAYQFKSSFFQSHMITMTGDIIPNTASNHKLSFLNKIYRVKKLSTTRTKVIVRPEYIKHMGIHHVAKLLDSNVKAIQVHDDSAIIHHYRMCSTIFDLQMHCGELMEDKTILKYSDLLTQNYYSTLDKNVKYFKKIKPP